MLTKSSSVDYRVSASNLHKIVCELSVISEYNSSSWFHRFTHTEKARDSINTIKRLTKNTGLYISFRLESYFASIKFSRSLVNSLYKLFDTYLSDLGCDTCRFKGSMSQKCRQCGQMGLETHTDSYVFECLSLYLFYEQNKHWIETY